MYRTSPHNYAVLYAPQRIIPKYRTRGVGKKGQKHLQVSYGGLWEVAYLLAYAKRDVATLGI